MQLTSNDLKFYHNTGLQGIVHNKVNNIDEIHTMIGLKNNLIYTDRIIEPIKISEFKPIVRKIGNLIEPVQNCDGVVVIPLFEIAKLVNKDDIYFTNKSLIKADMKEDSDYGRTLYACGWTNERDESYKMFFSVDRNSFYISRMGIKDLPKVVPNQFLLFKVLYSWHFWLNNNIYFDEKLIIDVNTI